MMKGKTRGSTSSSSLKSINTTSTMTSPARMLFMKHNLAQATNQKSLLKENYAQSTDLMTLKRRIQVCKVFPFDKQNVKATGTSLLSPRNNEVLHEKKLLSNTNLKS